MPTIPTQLKMWQELRDALNKTGRPIYTEFCPRSYGGTLVPPNKTTQDCNPGERCINDGPPHEWDGPTRANLANAILTEFGNSHDNWGSAMSNLDALLTLRPQPDVDGPGFFSDGDMLQTCNFGFGGTNCNAARGQCPSKGHMTQDEYTAQFATWAALASQMIISADLRNLQSAQPECFKLLKNADILAVSKVNTQSIIQPRQQDCQLTVRVGSRMPRRTRRRYSSRTRLTAPRRATGTTSPGRPSPPTASAARWRTARSPCCSSTGRTAAAWR